jgi:hypothetical protein
LLFKIRAAVLHNPDEPKTSGATGLPSRDPTAALSLLVAAAFPDVSRRCRNILDVIAETRGRSSAEGVAARARLRDRHQLSRILAAEGLPGFGSLSSWISVLWWVLEAERNGESLFHIAYRNHVDPATCHRTTKRTTGERWTEVRKRGSDWVLVELNRLHKPAVRSRRFRVG